MVYIKEITETEIQLLKDHYKKSHCALVRERAGAIILSSQRRQVSDIALILMRTEDTIRQWIHDFQERRISSIFAQYQGNANASKLTKRQKEEIQQTLQQSPWEKGLPKTFWDVPTLKEYIHAEFGVVYESERSDHYLLRFSGLSFKLPQAFDKRRNKEQINQRLCEIHREIEPYLTDNNWEIFSADETRITWEAEVRRAWLKKNAKTVLRIHRDNQYQNFFGVLNLKSQTAHMFRLDWQNQQTMISSLENLTSLP